MICPEDQELMRVAGDPTVLHASWCTVERGYASTLPAVRESLISTLTKHVGAQIQVVDDAEEVAAKSADERPLIRVQADVIAMSRAEFAACLRKVWAAAALQGAIAAREPEVRPVHVNELARMEAKA